MSNKEEILDQEEFDIEVNEESSEYADAYARHRADIKHLENNGFERVGDNKRGRTTTYVYSRRFRPKTGEEHQQFITFSHNHFTRENENVKSSTDKSWGSGPGTPARKETTGSITKHDSIQDAVEKHNQAKKNSIMNEETTAAKTIAPKGKADAMGSVMAMMSKMSGEDLNGFMAMMQQYGAGKEWGIPADVAAKNAASISAKPSHASAMKEDLEAIFDGEDLSEDFVEKTSTLFEAALNARIAIETESLQEQFEEKLNEEMNLFAEEVTNKLDSYLDYVAENWMQENEVAIESTLRNELMDEFMEGLKNLFAEHYIAVPEEKVDVLEALADKVDALEGKLDEAITENTQLKSVLVEEAAKGIFAELASDLALTQQEKFATLAEGIEFDGNLDTFAKKLLIIKESYFGKESLVENNIEDETFDGEPETVISNSTINRYAQAISKTVKK